METITKYFIDFSMIPGGIQIQLGYASLIALAWIGYESFKRILKSFKSKPTIARSY